MIFHCPFCGAKVQPSVPDCPSCARRMLRACPYCAEEIAVDAKLCKYCGEEVRPAAKATEARKTGLAQLRRPEIEFLEEPVVAACPWEDTSKGVMRRWWGTWKESNFHPARFFRAMPRTGGHKWPLGFAYGLLAQSLFLLVVGAVLVGGLATLTGHSIPKEALWAAAGLLVVGLPLSFIAVTIGLYVNSFFWHLLLKILGSKAGFEETLRVVSYSGSAEAWGLFFPPLQPIMQTVLHYHGFREVHGLSKCKALFASLFPYLLVFFVLAAGIAIALVAGHPVQAHGCCQTF